MNIRTIVTADDVFFSASKCPDSSIVLYCAMSTTPSGMNWISGPAKTAPVVSKTSFAAMVLPNATINLTKKIATELSFWDFRCSRMNLCKLNMLLQLHSCAFYGNVCQSLSGSGGCVTLVREASSQTACSATKTRTAPMGRTRLGAASTSTSMFRSPWERQL